MFQHTACIATTTITITTLITINMATTTIITLALLTQKTKEINGINPVLENTPRTENTPRSVGLYQASTGIK